MRFKLISVAMTAVVALLAGNVMAQEAKKKEQPAPESKQVQADKAKPEDGAKAGATKPGEKGEPSKAAVNTLEDLFAAYGGSTWTAPRPAVTPAPQEQIVWNVSVAPKPAAPKPAAPKSTATEKKTSTR